MNFLSFYSIILKRFNISCNKACKALIEKYFFSLLPTSLSRPWSPPLPDWSALGRGESPGSSVCYCTAGQQDSFRQLRVAQRSLALRAPRSPSLSPLSFSLSRWNVDLPQTTQLTQQGNRTWSGKGGLRQRQEQLGRDRGAVSRAQCKGEREESECLRREGGPLKP